MRINDRRLREERAAEWTVAAKLMETAERENRSLTRAEAAEYDKREARIKEIDAELKRVGAYNERSRVDPDIADTRGVPTGRVREPEHRYTGDDSVEGREHEVLRPDQSMATWLQRRRADTGRAIAHDVDWNAYWAQRMGLERPGLEMRALGESTSSGAGAGQAIVPQEWSTSFIDILRPQLVISRAGASLLPLESEIYNYPQYVSDVSPQWLAENTQMSVDANPQFSTVQFNAQGSFSDMTLFAQQLAEDTNTAGGLPKLLTDTIGKKYQRVIDQVAFYGVTGNAGNPGLLNESGLVTQALGTGNGAAPVDTTFLSTAAEAVRNANSEPTAFITNPKVVGTIERLNAAAYAKYWDLPVTVQGIPWLYSTALASNETLGTGTSLSSLYAGDWSKLIIGMRVDLQTQVLTERYADSNQIGIRSYMRFSIRAVHPEQFVRVQGIVTT